jgi:hypothetical protein
MNRTYALAARLGVTPVLYDRMDFVQHHAQRLQREGIAGRPVSIHTLQARNAMHAATEIYRQSIFCLVLAGDECHQKRFFDILASGCIPVVLEHAESDEANWTTWFRTHRCSRRRVYPYSRGIFFGDSEAGIDYTKLVVRISHLDQLQSTLNDLIVHQPRVIAQFQHNIAKYAPLLQYDLLKPHSKVDAVSAFLVTLQHYLHQLLSND